MVVRHAVYPGDPERNGGLRAEVDYDNTDMVDGVDYWFAVAIKLDAGWTYTNGTQSSSDRQSVWQVHQGTTQANEGGPFGVVWDGSLTGGAGNPGGYQVFTIDYSQGVNAPILTRFNFAANPGGWQRQIVHARFGFASSGDGPVLEMWVANGSGGYTQLVDQTPNANMGDPVTTAANPMWFKTGIYKWTASAFGQSTSRGMLASGGYWGVGANLLAQAQAALAPYAVQ
jgi:hypothetical protein